MTYHHFNNFIAQMMFCLFIFGNGSFLNAQWLLGVKAGCTNNRLYTAYTRGYSNYQYAQGYSMGLILEYRAGNNLAFVIEPSWIEKNYRNISTSIATRFSRKMLTIKNINNYLVLPLMVKFYLGQAKLKPFVDIGSYMSLWYSGGISMHKGTGSKPINSHDYPYSTTYEFDARRDKRIESGLLAGLGLNYQRGRHNLFVESRYDMSLTDVHKYTEKNMEKKNNTLLFSLGYMYQL